MSQSNHWCWKPRFANTGNMPTSGPAENGLIVADTSSAGTPTYRYVDGASEGGETEVQMAADVEVENVCVYQGDSLPFDIDQIIEARIRFKLKQAALDATSQIALGLVGDRNDTIDSIAQAAVLRIVGADNTTNVVVETDDGTNNNDDVATGKTIADTDVHELIISFAAGKFDVRFFLDGQPLAPGTTFDMSNYSGALQFFAQIQKTADANTDGFNLLEGTYVRGRSVLSA
ncbi:MAG: hypothetical protein IID45_11200 [Planctomycetes bacterium]|nr:hypothetical protein [Planctomycetota bacterium]